MKTKQTKIKAIIPLLILTLTIFCFISSASAVTPSTSDVIYVSTTGNDSNDGLTNQTAKLTIQNGLDSLNENGTLHIADGVYTGTYNAFVEINKNVNIIGQSQSGTILNGNGTYRILYINSGISAIIMNLTFINGNSSEGAAIYNDGNLTLSNCTFFNNSVYYDGGAIHDESYLTATQCTFIGNHASNGGAIFNCCGTENLINCLFADNTAESDAGAFFNEYGATLINCTFHNNTGNDGGAIHDESNLIISGCTFTNNTAYNDGGAINDCCGYETITGSTFTGNYAYNDGGAIYNSDYLNISFSRIVGNLAGYGSAIYNEGYDAIAEYNWWGSNYGPQGVNYYVDVDTWLILSITALPAEIFNGQTTNVLVNLYNDSDGNDHSNDSAKYPAQIPLIYNATWGSITQTMMAYGAANATFTANGGAIGTPIVANVSVKDAAADTLPTPPIDIPEMPPLLMLPSTAAVSNYMESTSAVSTSITINPAANLYVNISSNKNNPQIGETTIITYKLGNKGPDNAINVTITIPLPQGFDVTQITGDGNWTHNKDTRTITWTMNNVTVGDPFLYVTGKFTQAGSFTFGASMASETYNINTEDVSSLIINTTTTAQAANTVHMQNTGVPIALLIAAIFMVLGGFVAPKRKK